MIAKFWSRIVILLDQTRQRTLLYPETRTDSPSFLISFHFLSAGTEQDVVGCAYLLSAVSEGQQGFRISRTSSNTQMKCTWPWLPLSRSFCFIAWCSNQAAHFFLFMIERRAICRSGRHLHRRLRKSGDTLSQRSRRSLDATKYFVLDVGVCWSDGSWFFWAASLANSSNAKNQRSTPRFVLLRAPASSFTSGTHEGPHRKDLSKWLCCSSRHLLARETPSQPAHPASRITFRNALPCHCSQRPPWSLSLLPSHVHSMHWLLRIGLRLKRIINDSKRKLTEHPEQFLRFSVTSIKFVSWGIDALSTMWRKRSKAKGASLQKWFHSHSIGANRFTVLFIITVLIFDISNMLMLWWSVDGSDKSDAEGGMECPLDGGSW